MDYKDTVLLPKTSFPMRGNLPLNEPKRYKRWFEEIDAYDKMKKNRVRSKKKFNLHDGPPYANGHIHIGNALNKILKDIITKTHYFFGDDVRFTPGWDCHGLPIEQQVERNMPKDTNLDIIEVRSLCRKHAQSFIDIQKKEFKSLGVVCDWSNPYITMNHKFESQTFRALCHIAKRGLLIQRSKPVYWSWAAKSALAEAEVEYQDKKTHSVYIAFDILDEAKEALGVDSGQIVIWTTTPWTIPSNVAIALNPKSTYVLTTKNHIVAKDLYEKLKKDGVLKGEIKKSFNPKILEFLDARNPLNARESKILLADFVSMQDGSGCVHVAPGHGEDDYMLGLKHNLDMIMPVDDSGCFDNTVVKEKLFLNPKEMVGVNVFKANDIIINLLGSSILKLQMITHSYPFCWRTHKPIIYRATKQWFIAMDKVVDGSTLRQRALKSIKHLRFYPPVSFNRFNAMIENRADWCVSRQRAWGVPIAFFRDKKTKEIIFDEKVLNFVAMVFEHHSTDAWWAMPIKDLLYPGSGYDADNLEKVTDILDVWFDSGSTWFAVLKTLDYDAGRFPASLYLEGSDQHRGWFQSSLLESLAIQDKAPYKSVLTHGFTVDKHGKKMSKSKGNVILPFDVAKKHGVEILRFLVASSDYSLDLKISSEIIEQSSKQYKKIRNTIRFLLSNIGDLEYLIAEDNFGEIDRWILKEAKKIFEDMRELYKKYDYSKAILIFLNFITNKLSGIYLDMCKDRLYCNMKNDISRMSAQTVMNIILKNIFYFMSPILTYTIDEAIEHYPATLKGMLSDVFDLEYEPIKSINTNFDEDYFIALRDKFFEVVDVLKKDKKIGSTLELGIATKSKRVKFLHKTDMQDWLNISLVLNTADKEVIISSFKIEDDVFYIVHLDNKKCLRCWRHVLRNEDDNVCPRCKEVLKSNF